jgi:hypothetical protein
MALCFLHGKQRKSVFRFLRTVRRAIFVPFRVFKLDNPDVFKNKSYPSNKPWSPMGLWDVEDSIISGQSATDGGEVVSLYPQEDSWYSFLLKAESTPINLMYRNTIVKPGNSISEASEWRRHAHSSVFTFSNGERYPFYALPWNVEHVDAISVVDPIRPHVIALP